MVERKPFQDWELRLGYPDTFGTRARTVCRACFAPRCRKSFAGSEFCPNKNLFLDVRVRHRCRNQSPKEAYYNYG